MSILTMARRFAARRVQGEEGGSPIALMSTYTKGLLLRYRQVIPFPVLDHYAFLQSLYPGIPWDDAKRFDTPPWKNLAMTMNWDESVHFHLVGRELGEAFWIKFDADRQVPAPVDASDLLQVFEDNPYHDMIKTWMFEATKINDEIENACDELRKFFRSTKHPEHIQPRWPQLLPFVGALPSLSLKHVDKIDVRKLYVPTHDVREQITLLLAKCSLLSDAKCNAWIGYMGDHPHG